MRTKFIGFIISVLCGSLFAEDPWPKSSQLKEDSARYQRVEASSHHYRSKHFEIFAFQEPGHQLLTDFVLCAESVPIALKSLPLPLYAPPKTDRFTIRFFPTEQSYLDAGGAANTAGFYHSRRAEALFQWDHFLKKQDQQNGFQEPSYDLVVHELTHLSMHQLTTRVEVWFSEGVAEYLAAAYTGKGIFRFDSIEKNIVRRVKKHSPPETRTIQLPTLDRLIKATHRDWLHQTAAGDPWQNLESYNASLLLIHYAFHGGQERREGVHQHLKNTQTKNLLFPLQDASKIENALTTYWAKKGLTLSFREHP